LSIRFSIVIPVKEVNEYLRENISYIRDLEIVDWELIILPNNPHINEWGEKVRIIPTGKVGPAIKRDLGAEIAVGRYLVFFDDDSYPITNTLSVANEYFKDLSIAAIGGPAITPPQDNIWQRVSGAVFTSRLTGGNPERYISTGKSKFVDDWPSVNFMIRRSIFLEVGGFNSPYWPGEDTYFCWRLTTKYKYKILYAPDMPIFHHRRSGILQHLKQVGAYGIHRGFFAKKYPETSLKIKYFLPTLFFMYMIFTTFYFILPENIKNILILGWIIYGIVMIAGVSQISKNENIFVAFISIPYIFLTHFYYGYNFGLGLLKTKLTSKLR
jgi:GT2 family glycosyltransferase